jgi:hypothetical protein
MEASQTPPEQPAEQPAAPEPEAAPAAPEPEAPAAEEPPDRNPAEDQAPAATANQDAIIGDPGFRDEQSALANEGTPTNVDTPVRTSAPPAEMQSGMPLPEDRAAAAAAAAELEAEPEEAEEPASA